MCCRCKKVCHKNCYAPDLKDSRTFKCDECKRDNEYEMHCFICKHSNGILKELRHDKWVHILCALFCITIRVKSFRSLEFKQLKDDRQIERKECGVCGQKSKNVLRCWADGCESYAHIGCIMGYQFNTNMEYEATYKFLDRHSQSLVSSLKKEANVFKFLHTLKERKKRAIICNEHNDDPNFIHCPCNKAKLKDKNRDDISQVSCKICKRWSHFECTDLRS